MKPIPKVASAVKLRAAWHQIYKLKQRADKLEHREDLVKAYQHSLTVLADQFPALFLDMEK